MNKEQVQGSWNEFAGKVRQKWGKLTDNDVTLLKGHRQEFFGKLEKLYGTGKEKAEEEVKELEKNCNYCTKDEAA